MSACSGRFWGASWSNSVASLLLGVVEELRRIFIQHRELNIASRARRLRLRHSQDLDFKDPLLNQARQIIAGLTIEEAHRVTKAFAIYFELTNLAETNSSQTAPPGRQTAS